MFTPTIVKLVRCLQDSQARRTKQDLAAIIDEKPEYVNKAVEKLVALGLVVEEEKLYAYKATPYNEQLSDKLLQVYEAVDKKPELLIRGLICHIPSRYLFHLNTLLEILAEEGIDSKQANQFLDQEIKLGFLRRVRIAYLGIRPYFLPRYIPAYWFSQLKILGQEEYELFRQEYSGLELREEDYLLGQYPPELANPAREYMETERPQLKDKARTQGLLSWLEGFT